MPRRNTREGRRKLGFQHVYNRTGDRGPLFLDERDKLMFLEILDRYLAQGRRRDSRGKPYPRLSRSVRLVTFALMFNHFHLILFQLVPGGVEDLMRRVINSYTRYFHDRHGGGGSLFDGPYRSDHKSNRRAQLNAIAYVHDNHGDVCSCDFCGSRFFEDGSLECPGWLDAERGLKVFGGHDAYRNFRRSRHMLRDVTANSHDLA